jgi:hypothetical protein
MQYLKNALGGLARSLTDAAVQTLHEPRRWRKFALYAAVFVLPGGTLGVLALAWFERRRAQRQKQAAQAALLPSPAAPSLSGSTRPTAASGISPAALGAVSSRQSCQVASSGQRLRSPVVLSVLPRRLRRHRGHARNRA